MHAAMQKPSHPVRFGGLPTVRQSHDVRARRGGAHCGETRATARQRLATDGRCSLSPRMQLWGAARCFEMKWRSAHWANSLAKSYRDVDAPCQWLPRACRGAMAANRAAMWAQESVAKAQACEFVSGRRCTTPPQGCHVHWRLCGPRNRQMVWQLHRKGAVCVHKHCQRPWRFGLGCAVGVRPSGSGHALHHGVIQHQRWWRLARLWLVHNQATT